MSDDPAVIATSGWTGLRWTADEWAYIAATQASYEALVRYFGIPADRSGAAAMALHERITRILRGEEADPRPGGER